MISKLSMPVATKKPIIRQSIDDRSFKNGDRIFIRAINELLLLATPTKQEWKEKVLYLSRWAKLFIR